jgi:hypothetical protein
MPAYLGIDIDTQSAKGMLLDSAGRILATATRGYAYASPDPVGSNRIRKIRGVLSRTSFGSSEIERWNRHRLWGSPARCTAASWLTPAPGP